MVYSIIFKNYNGSYVNFGWQEADIDFRLKLKIFKWTLFQQDLKVLIE